MTPADDAALELLAPTVFDAAWWLIAAAALLLLVAALLRVVRAAGLTATARVLWVLLLVVAGPVGAIAALLLVPESARSNPGPTGEHP